MDRAGLSGDDGPTHHGLFDIAYLRSVPGLVLMAPKDEDELADMMKTALQLPGPSAIRYPRGVGPGAARKPEPEVIPVGKAEVLKDGSDVAILGLGTMMPLAAELAIRLERDGYSAAVINRASSSHWTASTRRIRRSRGRFCHLRGPREDGRLRLCRY